MMSITEAIRLLYSDEDHDTALLVTKLFNDEDLYKDLSLIVSMKPQNVSGATLETFNQRLAFVRDIQRRVHNALLAMDDLRMNPLNNTRYACAIAILQK